MGLRQPLICSYTWGWLTVCLPPIRFLRMMICCVIVVIYLVIFAVVLFVFIACHYYSWQDFLTRDVLVIVIVKVDSAKTNPTVCRILTQRILSKAYVYLYTVVRSFLRCLILEHEIKVSLPWIKENPRSSPKPLCPAKFYLG